MHKSQFSVYQCGVLNCGNGKCVHKLSNQKCPHCGHNLVIVTSNKNKFCSNHPSICDYEIASAEYKRQVKQMRAARV